MSDNEKIDIDLILKTANSAKGITDMKKSLKELKSAISQVEEGTESFKKLSAAAGKLKDNIDDTADATKAFTGTGIEKLTASMGLLKESFLNADPGKFKTAISGLGSAMSAIPIFLIVEGLKYLADNFKEVVKFLMPVNHEMVKLSAEYENQKIATAALTKELNREIELLEAQGASDSKIIAKKKELSEANIKEAEANIRLRKEKLKDIISNDSIGESIDRATAALYRKLGATKVAETIEKVIAINKANRAKEDLDSIKESEETIKDLKNSELVDVAKVETKKREEGKKTYEEEKKNAEQLSKDREVYKKEYDKLEEQSVDNIDAMLAYSTEFEKNAEQEKLDAVLAANAAKLNDSLLKIKEEQDAEKAELEEKKKSWAEEKQNLSQTFKEAQGYANLTMATLQGINDLENQLRDQKLQAFNEEKQNEIDTIQSNADAAVAKQGISEQQIIDIKNKAAQQEYEIKLAQYNQNIAIKKKEFENGKKLAIAMALISGAVAAVNALSAAPFFPMAIIGLAMATITTVLSVAKIASQKFDSGGSPPKPPTIQSAAGSSGIGNSSSSSPDQTKFLTPGLQKVGGNQGQFNGVGTGQISGKPNEDTKKVYVVADDISKQQDKSAIIARRASFNK